MYSVALRALKDSEWLRQLKEWILCLRVGIILCMGSANERRRYIVTSCLVAESIPRSVDNKRSHHSVKAYMDLNDFKRLRWTFDIVSNF